MDKYVNKNSDFNHGLDLIAKLDYVNRNKIKKNDLDHKLIEFKKLITMKLDNFTPTIKNKNNSFIDSLLKTMWIDYLTRNITNEKEVNLYHMLNFEYDKEKSVRFNEDSLILNTTI